MVLDAALGFLGELDAEVVCERVIRAACDLTGARYAAFGALAGLGQDAGKAPSIRTSLDVPVLVAGEPFGSLYVGEKAGGEPFTAEDEQVIVRLAALAGVAIGNARRYTRVEQRHRASERTVAALQATTEVTRAIGDETDLDAVLALVAEHGRALVSARVLVIELVRGEELLIAAGAGEVPDGLVGQRMPKERSFAEQAIGVRAAVRIEDEVSRARFNEVGVGRLGVKARSGLAVPLLFRERALGALIALDPLIGHTMFSAEDARLLEAFATSAATAVAVAHAVAADMELLASVVRSSTDAIITLDERGVITSWNPGAEDIYGYTAQEMVGRPGAQATAMVMPPDSEEREVEIVPRVLAGEVIRHYETRRVRKDGSQAEISLSVAAIHDLDGRMVGVASVARDVTEHRRTQRMLAQTERLESIGQLAGGVAHDMNNLLTIILNQQRFALDRLPADDPASSEIQEANSAAERAAALVRQLLLFARKEATARETLDLDEIVRGLTGMLGRTLGEHIALVTEPVGDPWPVQADRGQVEQVIVNLAVNARDAMPHGGTLTLATANVTLDQQQVIAHTTQGQPGDYLCLVVKDTGSGMTPEVVAKALDPFFTTKPAGAGTGLGLASVYGILRKTGGHLNIASKPGQGTLIETYWPVSAAVPETAQEPDQADAPATQHHGTGETILLVEDEQSLQRLTTRVLQAHGYAVLAAKGPADAKDLATRKDEHIALMITDVVMPETPGIQLAEQIHQTHPGLPVLYTSGYMPNPGELPAGAHFLAKPYTREQLLAAIADALDGENAAAVPAGVEFR